MRHFFEVYKALEKKSTVVDDVCDAEEAVEIIDRALVSYGEKIEPNLRRITF